MIKLNWKIHHLNTQNDIINLVNIFAETKPDYSGADTETTGLHIILDTPFVITFGWFNNQTKQADVFSYDLTINPSLNKQFFKILYLLASKTKKFLFWNAKYDLHMLANAGYPCILTNISDAEIYVRLGHDAIPIKDGGVPMDLKDYAFRYIDKNAKNYLNQIDKAKTSLLKMRTNELKQRGFKVGVINDFLKDKLNEITDLPLQVQQVYKTMPSPDNYKYLPRDLVRQYAVYDVIYTLEAFYQCLPIVEYREQLNIAKEEEQIIPILWKMERRGFKLNKQYALETKQRMKEYIIKSRKRLEDLFGKPIKVGQHKEIKEHLETIYNLQLDNCDKETLLELTYHNNSKIAEIAKLIGELRTLEKWYSTYIIKWTKYIDVHDRIYTSINQCGAVSGRVTSDFQQFPKEAILDNEGNELFDPRKLVEISSEGYNKIVYFDYSQIELRLQALYTIYVMGGDLNLCRAYMPFKCHHYQTNEIFDYNNSEHLKRWNEMKEGHPHPSTDKDGITGILKKGWSVWIKNENNEVWKPIDLHTQTTKVAYPDIPEGTPEFKHVRPTGKSTNFACNYGGTAASLHRDFGYPQELADRLYNAYITSYPGVLDFRKYIRNFLYTKPYIANLFGRRYYGCNSHKGCNYVIQGSGADFLKIKIIQIDKFLVDNNCQTIFQMNIHDELSFELYEGEEWIIPEIKRIMEELPGTKIPIVADVEITSTTWSAKEDYIA